MGGRDILSRKEKQILGRRGEKWAKEYLIRQGYEIIAENFACRPGEVDLIARDGRWLVFIEVRTRTLPARYGDPLASVDRMKQLRLQKAGLVFLQSRGRHLRGYPIRFDVVGIWLDRKGRVVKTELVRNAFSATSSFHL